MCNILTDDLSTYITKKISGYPMIELLRKNGMILIEECSLECLSQSTKMFINGAWLGTHTDPNHIIDFLKYIESPKSPTRIPPIYSKY